MKLPVYHTSINVFLIIFNAVPISEVTCQRKDHIRWGGRGPCVLYCTILENAWIDVKHGKKSIDWCNDS